MYEPAGHPTRHVRLHACPMDPVGWSLVITGTTQLARAHTTVTKSASVSFDLVIVCGCGCLIDSAVVKHV